jgi:hypothetical protein
VVPTIPLPAVTLSNCASRHAEQWFHIRQKKNVTGTAFLSVSKSSVLETFGFPDASTRFYAWANVYKLRLQIKISILHTAMSFETMGQDPGATEKQRGLLQAGQSVEWTVFF